MSHLLLAHLSKNNNCPQLVQELFNTHAGSTQVIVATRYQETPVYQIQQAITATTSNAPAHYRVAASQLELLF